MKFLFHAIIFAIILFSKASAIIENFYDDDDYVPAPSGLKTSIEIVNIPTSDRTKAGYEKDCEAAGNYVLMTFATLSSICDCPAAAKVLGTAGTAVNCNAPPAHSCYCSTHPTFTGAVFDTWGIASGEDFVLCGSGYKYAIVYTADPSYTGTATGVCEAAAAKPVISKPGFKFAILFLY